MALSTCVFTTHGSWTSSLIKIIGMALSTCVFTTHGSWTSMSIATLTFSAIRFEKMIHNWINERTLRPSSRPLLATEGVNPNPPPPHRP
jgi:hypothetical protein